MARVEIRHKCVTMARNSARRDSCARETGISVFIKRYYGRYRLLAVAVSGKQRACRELFAEAQRMAAEDLKRWNRRRYWRRLARVHRVKCGHRMAVSWYYKMLKECGLDGAKVKDIAGRYESGEFVGRGVVGKGIIGDGIIGDGIIRDGIIGDGIIGRGSVRKVSVGDGIIGKGSVRKVSVGNGGVWNGSVGRMAVGRGVAGVRFVGRVEVGKRGESGRVVM